MSKIIESGMVFDIPDTELYYIEKGDFMMRVQSVPSVEFLWKRKGKLLFVEAKSSFPKAGNDEDFERNMFKIISKFLYTLDSYLSMKLQVNAFDSDCPNSISDYILTKEKGLNWILVINCKNIPEEERVTMITFIQDQLAKRLKGYHAIWNIQIAVMDHNMAMANGIVRELQDTNQ